MRKLISARAQLKMINGCLGDNIDMRHNLTTSFTWELPFGRRRKYGSNWNGAADAILGGWQVGGILALRSGLPFEVTFPDDPQNSGTTDNPTIDNWFDQSAFVVSAPGV